MDDAGVSIRHFRQCQERPVPEVEIRGSLPQIIRNDQDLYEGDLVCYLPAIFNHAVNLNNPYHNFRHMFHVLWLCHDARKFYPDELAKRQAQLAHSGPLPRFRSPR
jgi:hypothetical protein